MPYLNRPSLYLERGIALMPGAHFADGTIEFDVAIHGHSGFAGRGVSRRVAEDYELIYLRTHRSRQWDALQYTPMFAGQEAWQLYAGARLQRRRGVAGQPLGPRPLVVDGYEARVFVDNAATPQLVVTDLEAALGARPGWTVGTHPAQRTFSNVKVTPVDRCGARRDRRLQPPVPA